MHGSTANVAYLLGVVEKPLNRAFDKAALSKLRFSRVSQRNLLRHSSTRGQHDLRMRARREHSESGS